MTDGAICMEKLTDISPGPWEVLGNPDLMRPRWVTLAVTSCFVLQTAYSELPKWHEWTRIEGLLLLDNESVVDYFDRLAPVLAALPSWKFDFLISLIMKVCWTASFLYWM